MLPFAGVVNNLKRIQSDFIEEILKDIVTNNALEIIDLNTKDQLSRDGVDNEGVDITPSYSNPYKRFKELINQPSDRVTLKLTGDFHKSFFIDINNKSFRIDAKDSKTEGLVKKYGEKIFGLTDSNLDLFKELIVQPELIERIKKQILKR